MNAKNLQANSVPCTLFTCVAYVLRLWSKGGVSGSGGMVGTVAGWWLTGRWRA